MPRVRKRDWPVRVWKFWATPSGDLPQEFWLQARAMQWLWNELLERRERALEAAHEIPKEDKERRQEFWKDQETETNVFLSSDEVKERLGWEAREFVADRFRTAARKAAKERATLRPKLRLDNVIIPHRYTGGGLEAEKFFGGRRFGLRIEPLPEDAFADQSNQARRRRRTRGVFGVDGGAQLDFRAYLHRPLPRGAVVKQVAWSSKRHPTRGWQHALLVWAEEPPGAVPPRESTNLVAALDVGWRKIGDFLRVGVVYDNTGNVFELRLPLTETGNAQTRKDELPDSYADIQRLTAEVSKLVDETKEGLRELLPDDLPDEARALVSRLVQLRQGKLVRLLRVLEEAGDSTLENAVLFLRAWREKNDHLRKRINDTRDRLLRRRNYVYNNIAVWISQHYDRLVVEGDLSLKDMAEHTGGDEALEAAAKYRMWASLFVLRTAVKGAAAKAGVEVIAGESKDTTTSCMDCGRKCEPTARLVIKCPVGHANDQDKQAAYNLLKQIPPEEVPPPSLALAQVMIPDHLKSYVVPLHYADGKSKQSGSGIRHGSSKRRLAVG